MQYVVGILCVIGMIPVAIGMVQVIAAFFVDVAKILKS